jgi:spore germination protein YaaH
VLSLRPRPLPVALSVFVLLLAALPVRAADPPPTGPTVHHEMLVEHADDVPAFTPGGAPAPLAAPDVGGGAISVAGEASGGIAALPNGLSKEVFGYLPYWAVTPAQLANLDYRLVTSIAYFSVGARGDGTLAKTTSTGAPTTGWAAWTSADMTSVISKAHARGVRVVLTVTMMAWDYDFTAMTNLLTSPTNRARLAAEIASAVEARGADGVSLDFEPMPNSLEAPYTAFVRELKAKLKSVGAGSYLTVATTGGAASWDEGYDLAGLTAPGAADALMVMAYDFNWSGSARAGAVAPMDSPYVLDARSAMADFLARVPGSKLIWGVPYYGRAWTTTSSTLNGRTCRSSGTCQVASWASTYVDARAAAAERGRRWDPTGQVPWYTYRSTTYRTYVQGYYDDAQSLSGKYKAVKANGLRGIGIWHLLMDGSRRELWDTIATRFGPLPFTDIEDSKFAQDIVWLADAELTTGCTPTRFCPEGSVTRAQMATFLARALHLPAATRDWFTDDGSSSHQASINRLAEAGITAGCGSGRFCPNGLVTRAQMATFLARGLHLPAATRDWFTDDSGSRHEANINRLAQARITAGCAPGRFCPSGIVAREQMAAFLRRALT